MQQARADIIAGLQSEILRMQGFTKPSGNGKSPIGLGPINDAFPNRTFPLGAVHEFIPEVRKILLQQAASSPDSSLA